MYDQEHCRPPAIAVGEDGDENGAEAGASPREADPGQAPGITLANLLRLNQFVHQIFGHQVELSDDRGLLGDWDELAVPEDDIVALLLGVTLLGEGGGRGRLPVARRVVSPHNWLVRLAEGSSDGHQPALK